MKVKILKKDGERVEFERCKVENASLRRENDKLRKVLSQITDLVNNNSNSVRISSRKKTIKNKNIANKRHLKSRQEKEEKEYRTTSNHKLSGPFDSDSSVYFTAKSSSGESTFRDAVSDEMDSQTDDESDVEMETVIDDIVRCTPEFPHQVHPDSNSVEFSLTMPNISLAKLESSCENIKKCSSFGWSFQSLNFPNGRSIIDFAIIVINDSHFI